MTENPIEKTIKAQISNQNAHFVFPTQTAASLWADIAAQIGRGAVASERFMGWDSFKENSIKNENPKKKSVPALMRSIFSANLIEENAKNPFLKSIIAPRFAEEAGGFAKWISKMLPPLSSWSKKISELGEKDEEDEDLLKIYEKYSDFLEKHNLFDPAWETPPFKDDGKDYYIFYPEILTDYAEYKEILEDSKKIHLIHTSELPSTKNKVYFYENTRIELSELAARLRFLHEERGFLWKDIAVSVPDLDSYSPYIERELALHEIPFTTRTGSRLSETKAGGFFSQIQDCANEKFSFATVKSLLTNTSLPWKNPQINSDIITFGQDNNCLCSYKDRAKLHDSWEDAFKYQRKNRPRATDEMRDFYKNLKRKIQDITSADTFKNVRNAYFIFRNAFFDMDLCSEESDNIISTCINKLGEICDIESKFSDYPVPNPYSFFVSHLSEETYVPQKISSGVQIFAYRNSAESPFACQIVLDASQNSLSMSSLYKRMSFLSEQKRKKLGIEDTDPTEDFIKIYSSASGGAIFSAAEKTISGYAFPHGLLESEDKRAKKDKKSSRFYDHLLAEKSCLLEKTAEEERYDFDSIFTKTEEYPKAMFKTAKRAFFEWSGFSKTAQNLGLSQDSLKKIVADSFFDKEKGLWKITQSALKDFFVCPRLWLFKNILKTKIADSEAVLIDSFALGNIKHEIMEEFCLSLKNSDLDLRTDENGFLGETRLELLKNAAKKTLAEFKTSKLSSVLLSTNSDAIFENTLKSVCAFSQCFAGSTVIDCEKTLESVPNGKNYFLDGRIDCLLRFSDAAGIAIVDYKSSSSSIPKKLYANGEKKADPQMPMYIRLLEANGAKADAAAFFSLEEEKSKAVFVVGKSENHSPSKSKKEEIDFSPTLAEFDSSCEEYAKRIAKADFSIDEKAQNYAVCTSKDCADFRASCRRFFNVSGRNAD